jgi:hypothetical protein
MFELEIRFSSVPRHTCTMTEGEITFHLREILAHWTAPRITTTTAAELERQKLIEFSEDRRLVRLTPDGVQRKIAGRLRTEDSTISSVPRRQPPRRRRRQFTAPKRMV